MQEEFEKKIQERMHTFGIQPSHQVWDEIDAVLSKKKHRRIFIGWWILLGLIIGSGGGLLYEKNNIMRDKSNLQPGIIKDTSENNLARSPLNPNPLKDEKIEPATAQKNISGAASPHSSLKEGMVSKTGRLNGSVATNAGGKDKLLPSKNNITVITPNIVTAQNNNTATTTQTGLDKKMVSKDNSIASPQVADKEPPSVSANDGQKINRQDIASESQAKNILKPKDASLPVANVVSKTTNPSKHQWFFSLSSGTTQTAAGGSFNTGGNSYSPGRVYAYQSVLPLSSLAAYRQDIDKPGIGFRVAAGGVYQYNLSSRWKISAGLQIAYVSNTQKTGAYYNNSFNVATGAIIPVPFYYQAGPSNTLVNKAWQIEVPVGISYVFNPKAKTKFMIDGGLSFASAFSRRWLITDSRYDKIYYNPSLLNSSIFSFQAGPSLQLHNQLKFGLQFERSFTTVEKNYVTPKLYWQHISLFVAIPLTSSKKQISKSK